MSTQEEVSSAPCGIMLHLTRCCRLIIIEELSLHKAQALQELLPYDLPSVALQQLISCLPMFHRWLSYRLVYMEELSFKGQLEAFAQAQVLVMGHGAAFTNILFMAPVSTLPHVYASSISSTDAELTHILIMAFVSALPIIHT